MCQPPAWFHSRILVGPGVFLTPRFVSNLGITHVINCAMDYDSPVWFQQKYPQKYACLRAIDSLGVNILDWYPAFDSILHSFLREGTGIVYVHCQAGMNRSGSLALAYVCKRFHMPLDETIQSVRKQRPVLLQNPVFMDQVREFINGRVSCEKNSGFIDIELGIRNSGLSSSKHYSRLEGVQDNAGESEDRTRDSASNNIGTVLEK
jgi:hypothetical protein